MNHLDISRRLTEEWSGNWRLQAAVHCIIITLFLYAALLFSDRHQQTISECQDIIKRVSRLNTLAAQNQWPDLAENSHARLVQAETRFQTAETPGLAQAKVQTWLDKMIIKTNIQKPRISIDKAKTVPGFDSVVQVAAHLKAPFDYESLFKLLLEIENSQQINQVYKLDVTGKKPYFSTTVKFYFRVPVHES